MNVVFAPDWRGGVPYQILLAGALRDQGIHVDFLKDYKRILPLARLVGGKSCDLLHLHWPEAYYPKLADSMDWFRSARFPLDLALAVRNIPLVVTAHNLRAHNRGDERFASRNYGAAFQRARIVVAHSNAAKQRLVQEFRLLPQRIHVIPVGDLSARFGPLLDRRSARAELGLGDERVCLMFGAIEPYKGIEEVIHFWDSQRPDAILIIVGKALDQHYAMSLRQMADGIDNVQLQFGWLSDVDLRKWLGATDCVLFNYHTIFTSGAACLTRSLGIPMVLPQRLDTLDLDEPHSSVVRFESFGIDFVSKLQEALSHGSDYAAAADWRRATAWPRIAAMTAEAYREATGVDAAYANQSDDAPN
jgi:glycosyltransferase involved in cell wall biosynthesis